MAAAPGRADESEGVSGAVPSGATRDTGCPHPEFALVDVGSAPTAPVWCRLCGSLCDRGGWVAPRSLVLPGWSCTKCGAFNSAARELRTDCRSCGAPFDMEAP
jgi:hypothetical protein